MENNNGRGIFYGVIGVATLVVAIIGATFAYFTASANLAGAVQTGTASVALEIEALTGLAKTDLIPIDTQEAGVYGNKDADDYTLAFAKEVSLTNSGACVDENGNNICSIHQFTVKNGNAAKQTITGYINTSATTEEKTALKDMHFAVFVGAFGATADGNLVRVADGETIKNGGSIVCPTTGTEGTNGVCNGADGGFLIHEASSINTLATGEATAEAGASWTSINGSTIVMEPYSEVTFTVVVWVEETYVPQNEAQDKTFTANVFFTTDGDTGVTGKLTV